VSNIAQAANLRPIRIGLLARWEVKMDHFIHAANIALYRKLIAESELDSSRDETRHEMLLTLLAEEMAKEKKPPNSQTLAELHSAVLMITALTIGA
jgi:hypothetical protein